MRYRNEREKKGESEMQEQQKSITPELVRFMQIADTAVQMDEENYSKTKAEILQQARSIGEGARRMIQEFFTHVDAARSDLNA